MSTEDTVFGIRAFVLIEVVAKDRETAVDLAGVPDEWLRMEVIRVESVNQLKHN